MKWFSDLTTRTKLGLSFGVILLLLALNILSGMVAMRRSEAVYEAALRVATIDALINEQRATVMGIVASPEDADMEGGIRHMEGNRRRIAELVSELEEVQGLTPHFRERLKDLNRMREDLGRARHEEEIPALLEGDHERALRLAVGQHDLYLRVRDLGHELVEEAEVEASRTVQKAKLISVSIGLVALVVGLLLILVLNALLARPLTVLSRAAGRIAEGDLSGGELPGDRHDEVGDLARSFGEMTHSLRGFAAVAGEIAAGNVTTQISPRSDKDVLGRAFAEMIANLRNIVSELSEGINVLATSSNQMSAATGQLASSATETAAAVNETTTTVTEVRQTAQVSHEKARSVASSSEEANQVAEDGIRLTDELGQGISLIREQMNGIAQRMVALSERSQTIGQIVNSVEELAVQSNLLAVNAAIEASKAGEHGKGFGVVADEVRNLAEQSRDATRQIRDILADVQKAISSAVMATEQGTKAVDAGVDQSKEARVAIHALSGRVEDAARAASQIAASNHQQLVGVDQVASAMKNIQEASSQNVSSAKQLESASTTLTDLGRRLKAIVDRYRT